MWRRSCTCSAPHHSCATDPGAGGRSGLVVRIGDPARTRAPPRASVSACGSSASVCSIEPVSSGRVLVAR